MYVYREKDLIDPKENINVTKLDAPVSEIHTHEFVELVYIYSGSVKHSIGNEVYEVKEGDLLFIDMGQTHSFYDSKDICYVNILLKPEFVSDELINSTNIFEVFTLAAFDDFDGKIEKSVRVVSFSGIELIKVRNLIDDLVCEFSEKRPGYRSAMRGYINVLFAYAIRAIDSAPDELRYMNGAAGEILTYIENNFSEKITLRDLAARCFYTPTYFSRVFKQCYGMSFKSYVKNKRIEKATEYLLTTDFSVEKVIELVGYSDRSLFFKHFKEVTGKTPCGFRTQKQKNAQ